MFGNSGGFRLSRGRQPVGGAPMFRRGCLSAKTYEKTKELGPIGGGRSEQRSSVEKALVLLLRISCCSIQIDIPLFPKLYVITPLGNFLISTLIPHVLVIANKLVSTNQNSTFYPNDFDLGSMILILELHSGNIKTSHKFKSYGLNKCTDTRTARMRMPKKPVLIV